VPVFWSEPKQIFFQPEPVENKIVSATLHVCNMDLFSGQKKNVMLMTSMVPHLGRTDDHTKKLFIINMYNFTMNGTDRYSIINYFL